MFLNTAMHSETSDLGWRVECLRSVGFTMLVPELLFGWSSLAQKYID